MKKGRRKMNDTKTNRQMTIAEKYGHPTGPTVEEVMEIERREAEEKATRPPLNGYTRMWMKFMEDHHLGRKAYLKLEGLWQQTIEEVDKEIQEMSWTLRQQYLEKYQRPTGSSLEILQYEEQLKSWLEEILFREIVHKSR